MVKILARRKITILSTPGQSVASHAQIAAPVIMNIDNYGMILEITEIWLDEVQNINRRMITVASHRPMEFDHG